MGSEMCIRDSLRPFNRMNDLVEGCKVSGSVKIGGTDVYQTNVNLTALRKNVGMVFQKPNPFPMSIYDNVAFGPRNFGIKNKAELDFIVETSLKQAAMWDELKDRLGKSALGISGGQQQRVALARALAAQPRLLLLDEPFTALDNELKEEIRALVLELHKKFRTTTVLVTHDRQEAFAMADRIAVMRDGRVMRQGSRDEMAAYLGNKEGEA